MLRWFEAFYSVDAVCISDARAGVFIAGDEYVVAIDGKTDRRIGLWADDCYPVAFCTDAAAGKLYCLSYPPLVTAIDQATDSLLANVPLDYYSETACLNTVDRKVYVAGAEYGLRTIAVLDGVGDSLLTEIAVDGEPTLLAYNPTDDVLFAAGGSYDIQAIDGKADSVIDYFQVNELPTGLVYNDAQHKLYSLGKNGTVAVIDPSVHGVNTRIQVGAGLGCFALNSSGSRFYCGSPRHDSVYVIDCVQEGMVCAIPVAGPPVALCYDSPHDRLYSASSADSGLSVIDCARNMVVATVPVAAQYLYYDSTSDAVYCLGENKLTVVDGQTGAIVRTLASGSYPAGIASAPGWTRVYAGCGDNSYLSVVRKSAGPAEMAVQAAPEPQATVVRRSLRFAGKAQAVLFDMSGRWVDNLHPGPNDVSGLAPGVYFLREAQAQAQAVRKVIITR